MHKITFLLAFLCLYSFAASSQELCETGTESVKHHIIKTAHTIVYTKPEVCKPLQISDFTAIKDYQDPPLDQVDYALNWSKQDHDLWHVTQYEVRINGATIQTFDHDVVLPIDINQPVPDPIQGLADFEIRACSSLSGVDPVCGDWQPTVTQCEIRCDDLTLPVPVVSVTENFNNSGDFVVSWTDGGYELYEFQEKFDGVWNKVADVNGLTYALTNKSNGFYKYRVYGHNGNVFGGKSNSSPVTVELERPIIAPLPEINTSSSYTVEWSAVNYDDAVVRYKLQQSTDGNSWSTVSNVKTYAHTFNNQNINTTYFYRVKACRASTNCSEFSDTVSTSLSDLSIDSFVVYHDSVGDVRSLVWTAPDLPSFANISGVHYRITASELGTTIIQLNQPADLPTLLESYDVRPDSYSIQACINSICGDPVVVSTFNQGLTPPINLTSYWNDANDAFEIQFFYPQSAWDDPAVRPQTFKVSSSVPQSDGSNLVTEVLETSGNTTDGWKTGYLSRNEVVGSAFTIKACRDDLGCSHFASVAVLDPSPEMHGLPNLVQSATPPAYDPNSQTVELSWTFDNLNQIALDRVKYIEITELQPYSREDQIVDPAFNNTLGTYKTFVTHNIEGPLVLSRFAEGYYNYSMRACGIDLGGIEGCSNLINATDRIDGFDLELTRDDVELVTATNPNPLPDVAFRVPTSMSFVENAERRYITWQDQYDRADYYLLNAKPGVDHANIEDRINQPVCLVDGNKYTSFRVDRQSITIVNSIHNTLDFCDNIEFYKPFSNIHNYGVWELQACINGVGCTEALSICDDGTNTAPSPSDPQCNAAGANQVDASLILDSNNPPNLNPSEGPGALSPGSYWHPDLGGSGWHFYWANGLNQTEQDGRYHQAYDLVGYWFAFRKINDRYTPTWFEARLRKGQGTVTLPGTTVPREYFQGNLYHHIRTSANGVSPVVTDELDVGNIQLLLTNPGNCQENCDNNQRATLILDLDDSQGIFNDVGVSENIHPYTRSTDSSGELTGALQLEIEDIAIDLFNPNRFNKFNDDDHYQGLWQHGIVNEEAPLSSAEVSMLTWIEGGLENTLFAYYDANGIPIWVYSQSCPQRNGTTVSDGCPLAVNYPMPSGKYFEDFELTNGKTLITIRHGFNPIAEKPPQHEVGDGKFAVGNFGRAFEKTNVEQDNELDINFKQAYFWLDVDTIIPTIANQSNSRDITYSNGVQPNGPIIDHDVMATLEKKANLHGIFFDILREDNFDVVVCDPQDNGPCEVSISWYTDDAFDDIVPYVIVNNNSSTVPLEDLAACPAIANYSNQANYPYMVVNYQCTFTSPGKFVFQLRKPKYQFHESHDPPSPVPFDPYNTYHTEVIAQSRQLEVLDCQSGNCGGITIPVPQIEADPVVYGEAENLMDPIINHVVGSGPVPGRGGVSGGAATYNIPVSVPPGRNGMTPDLSINYSSKGGNGLMGIGWSVSAGSSISRCSANLAQDGYFHAVNFTNQDRLCLGGQKLKLVSGNYLTSGSTYRTEIDSFAKIMMQGNEFKVFTKSGRVKAYQQLGSTSKETTWYLTQETDSYGNNIIYQYNTNNVPAGEDEFVITEINYTGYNNALGNRKVVLGYTSRVDNSESYFYGKRSEQTLILTGVSTYVDSTLIAQYGFTYNQSPSTGYSLLQKITETRGGVSRDIAMNTWSDNQWNDPVNPSMTYENIRGVVETFLSQQNADVPSNLANLTTSLDFNGDGIKELTYGPKNEQQAQSSGIVFLNDQGQVIKVLHKADAKYANKFGAGDLNADGINDLISLDIDYNSENFELVFYEYNAELDIKRQDLKTFDDYFTKRTINLGIVNGDTSNSLLTPGIDWGVNSNTEYQKVNMDPEASEYFIRDYDNDGLDDLVILVQLKSQRGWLGAGHWDNEDLWTIKSNLLVFRNTSTWTHNTATNAVFNMQFASPKVLVPSLEPKFEREDEAGGIEMYLYDKIETIEDFNGDGLLDVHTKRLVNARPSWISDVPVVPSIVNEKVYFTAQVGFPAVPRTFADLGLTNFQCEIIDTSSKKVVSDDCDQSTGGITGFGPNSFDFQDVNGDGLKDLLYYDRGVRSLDVDSNMVINENIKRTWKVRLNRGGSFNTAIFSPNSISANIPANGVDEQFFLPQGDICQNLDAINPAHHRLFRICNFVFRAGTKTGDINSDGSLDLLYPNPDDLAFNRCILTPAATNRNTETDICAAESTPEAIEACAVQRDMYMMSALEQATMNPFINDQQEVEIFNNQGSLFGGGTGCLDGNCITPPEDPQSIDGGGGGPTLGGGNANALCSQGDSSRYDLYVEAGGLNALWDRGVYGYSALEFKIRNGSLAVTETANTGLYSTLFWGGPGDQSGDGISDFISPYGCFSEPQGYELLGCDNNGDSVIIDNLGLSNSDILTGGGALMVINNQEPMPDMLEVLTQPTTEQWYEWDYHSIATELPGRPDLPLYSLPERANGTGDGYINEVGGAGEYFYFNSSMYVVSEMRMSTGLYASGTTNETYSSTQYGYQEAVYNNRGRGFQGFRTITAINKPNSNNDFNKTKSVSEFHQVFPLAGGLERVVNYTMGDVGFEPASETNYDYVDDNISSINGVVFRPMEEVVTQSFEAGGQLRSTQTQSYLVYDNYGNVTSEQSTLVESMALNALGTSNQTITTTKTTTNVYDPVVDTQTKWWIDKLHSTIVSTDVSESGGLVKPPEYNGNNLDRSMSTYYFWSNDGLRKLNCQFTLGDGATVPSSCGSAVTMDSSKTSYLYDDYGNIEQIKATGVTPALGGVGLTTQNRITDSNYNLYQGYFPNRITKRGDVLTLVTEFEYDLGNGQVTQSTDPNGLTSISTYDAYIMPLTQRTENSIGQQLEHTTATAMTQCGLGGESCSIAQSQLNQALNSMRGLISSQVPTNEFDLSLNRGFFINGSSTFVPEIKYVSSSRKPGAPMVKNWHDNSGNVVMTETTHSGGKSYVVSLSNPLGQVEISTDPFAVGTDPHFTMNSYDERGRLYNRLSRVGDLTGAGDNCWRLTNYLHNRGRTDITAETIGPDCDGSAITSINMSRTYDVQGKLRRTTQFTDTEDSKTVYWYDSAGNPYIVFVETSKGGHGIVTEFDDLGRKLSVDDPNMGRKEFTYNSFGELVEERDAEQLAFEQDEGVIIGNHLFYNSLGQLETHYWNVNHLHQAVTSHLAYQDSFIYDGSCGSKTALCDAYRYSNLSGPNTYGLNLNSAQQKSYLYDSFSRPIREETILTDPIGGLTSQAYGDAEFATDLYYYQNYNFPKQTVYNREGIRDDGESFFSVVNHYDVFGSLRYQYEGQTNVSNGLRLMESDLYNFRGQLTRKRLIGSQDSPNTYYTYYPNGQLKQIDHKRGSNISTSYQKIDYEYDAWGNISGQTLTLPNSSVHERFTYDSLQRITTSWVGNNPDNKVDYFYDNEGLGNLIGKSDFASTQVYGANSGPNAITASVLIDNGGTLNYQYDARGNRRIDFYTEHSSQGSDSYVKAEYVYDANNLLVSSFRQESNDNNQWPEAMHYRYGVDHQRYLKYEVTTNSDNQTQTKEATVYGGPYFEEVINLEYLNKELKVQVSDYLILTVNGNNSMEKHFMLKDRLGSTTMVLNGEGNAVKSMSYDVFGKPRDGDTWQQMANPELDFNDSALPNAIDITERGFTDHEHLDNFELIHMNGRMYDFNNGRFLSVDPFVHGETSQGLNPYSYILNNPLSGVDPTGYIPCRDGVDNPDCMPMPEPVPEEEESPRDRFVQEVIFDRSWYNGANQLTKKQEKDLAQVGNHVETATPNEQEANFLQENFGLQITGEFIRENFGSHGIIQDGSLSTAEAAFIYGIATNGLSVYADKIATPYISWLGKNQKWYPYNHHPNGATGTRQYAMSRGLYVNATQELFDYAAKGFFFFGAAWSGGEMVMNLRNPDVSTLSAITGPSVDILASYVGTYGGPYGFGLSLVYFATDTFGEPVGTAIGTGAAMTVDYTGRFLNQTGQVAREMYQSYGRMEQERQDLGAKPIFMGPKY